MKNHIIMPTHIKLRDTLIKISEIVICEKSCSSNGLPTIKVKVQGEADYLFIGYTNQKECDEEFKDVYEIITKARLVFEN